ncbi:MAG: potassium/proton antiporter [Actinomycetes bacterium]
MADLNVLVAAASGLLLLAVLTVRVARTTRLPSLLLYLALGLALGESGLGLHFNDAALTQTLGLLALALILAEGGLATAWRTVRPAMPFAALLATVGVVVTVGVVALVAHPVLGGSWRLALLIGAVVASTDAAAVFSVLRSLPLRPRLVAALEAESGLNDAPVVLLVVLLTTSSGLTWWAALLLGIYELAAGGLIGLAIGWVGSLLLRRSALPVAGLYPLATLAIALLAFACGGLAHASGLLAVYVAGLVLGNTELPHRQATRAVADSMALLAQAGLFILLGLLASPGRLPAAVLPALAVGAVLTFVGRPLAVAATAGLTRLVGQRWQVRDQVFLSWAGLRGAVPIVLATFPITAGVRDAQRIFDLTFVLVVVYTLLQAPTLPALARRLGVTLVGHGRELVVDAAPLEDLRAELMQVQVPAGSRLAGVYVDELRLPGGARVIFVRRGDHVLVPDAQTVIAAGDTVVVVLPSAMRHAVDERIALVHSRGRLGAWRPASVGAGGGGAGSGEGIGGGGGGGGRSGGDGRGDGRGGGDGRGDGQEDASRAARARRTAAAAAQRWRRLPPMRP